MYPFNPPKSPKETLPTMYDLPSENPEEPGLDEFHFLQTLLLNETFLPITYPSDQIFSGLDLNLYYDSRHPLWYKRPDWFAVVGVDRLYEQRDLRMSYVVWQEGVDPFIVVELLSPGTEDEDLGQTLRDANKPPTKWEVYEQILRIPYYVTYDRYQNQLQLFQLQGTRYVSINLLNSRLWLEELQLGLGLWRGNYRGMTRPWLRWYDATDNWILLEAERTAAANQALEQERQRAERLKEQLRSLGVEPDLD